MLCAVGREVLACTPQGGWLHVQGAVSYFRTVGRVDLQQCAHGRAQIESGATTCCTEGLNRGKQTRNNGK